MDIAKTYNELSEIKKEMKRLEEEMKRLENEYLEKKLSADKELRKIVYETYNEFKKSLLDDDIFEIEGGSGNLTTNGKELKETTVLIDCDDNRDISGVNATNDVVCFGVYGKVEHHHGWISRTHLFVNIPAQKLHDGILEKSDFKFKW